MKQEEREEPTQLLDRVFLGCTQRECKSNKNLVDECKKMFETLPLQELLRSYLVLEKSNDQITAGSYDVEGHAKKCVER